MMITPRWDIINRRDRRIVWNETRRVAPILLPVVNDFLNELFNGEASYIDLYDHYNAQWHKTCSWVEAHLKPKLEVCEINIYFFSRMYKPLEKEESNKWIIKLHESVRC